jgi:hypothetical protein
MSQSRGITACIALIPEMIGLLGSRSNLEKQRCRQHNMKRKKDNNK